MKTPSESQLEALAKQLKSLSSIEPTVADGSITNAKLAKNSVKSDNIDWTTIINKIYPVGSIYTSVNNTNPSTFIGGTWELFGKGKTLVGYNSAETEFNALEKTGGSKTVTLTVEQMPSHSHGDRMLGGMSGKYQGYVPQSGAGTQLEHATSNAGGNQPHPNMPPYITVNFWKRIS